MAYDPRRHHRQSIRLKGYDYTQAGAYFVTVVTQDRVHLFGEVVKGEMRLNEAGRMVFEQWQALPTRFATVEIDEFVVMPNHIHGIIILRDPLVGADLVSAPTGTSTGGTSTGGTSTGGASTGGTSTGGASTGGTSTGGASTGGASTGGASTGGASTGGTSTGGTSTGGTSTGGTSTGGTSTGGTSTRDVPTLGDVIGAFKSLTTVEYIRGVKQLGWAAFRGRLWQRNYYEHIIRDERALERIRRYIADNPRRWELDREHPAAR